MSSLTPADAPATKDTMSGAFRRADVAMLKRYTVEASK